MTNDSIISVPALAWQMGIRQGRLREFLYDTLTPEERPGKGTRWNLSRAQVENILNAHTNIPEAAREPKTMRDGDEMYDLADALTVNGTAFLLPNEDTAAIMRELIEDHDMPVRLISRNHLQTIIGL